MISRQQMCGWMWMNLHMMRVCMKSLKYVYTVLDVMSVWTTVEYSGTLLNTSSQLVTFLEAPAAVSSTEFMRTWLVCGGTSVTVSGWMCDFYHSVRLHKLVDIESLSFLFLLFIITITLNRWRPNVCVTMMMLQSLFQHIVLL